MTGPEIIALLPYDKPFLFVDKISEATNEGVKGSYTFKKESFFYEGHFKGYPITPGVILTECMAQIGLVCFGIKLLSEADTSLENVQVALSSTEIDFLKPVFPEEQVFVESEKIYFRFNKLKCKVKMLNSAKEVVSKGTISGMLIPMKA